MFDSSEKDLIVVCRQVCGIQAQLTSAAQIALWTRIRSLDLTKINSALYRQRTLVRTSAMRQTLHWLTAQDFPVYIAALRASRLRSLSKIFARFAVPMKEVSQLSQAILDALREGPMTQAELSRRVAPKTGSKLQAAWDKMWNIQRFRAALVEGLICYGPDQGRSATYVRVDGWLPDVMEIGEAAAQKTLLRRYLSVYGPADLKDFSKWAGFSLQEAKPIWRSLRDELVEVEVDGSTGFLHQVDVDALENADLQAPTVRMLPSFDPFLLTHVDKDPLVEPRHYKKVYRKAAWISPVVLLDGRVVGTWRHQRDGNRLRVEVVPFATLSKAVCAMISSEACRLAGFLGFEAEISFAA